eukprot:SM001872S03958  [mRNA]  locus=s1872:1226:1842:+ [translate_table: standard]
MRAPHPGHSHTANLDGSIAAGLAGRDAIKASKVATELNERPRAEANGPCRRRCKPTIPHQLVQQALALSHRQLLVGCGRYRRPGRRRGCRLLRSLRRIARQVQLERERGKARDVAGRGWLCCHGLHLLGTGLCSFSAPRQCK